MKPSGSATVAKPEEKPKESGQKTAHEVEHIVKQANELSAGHEKRTEQKEKALEHLANLQELFEEKDKQLQNCQARYTQVMKALNEKRAKRDHLKEQVDECNRMMAGLVKTTLDHSRKAHFHNKELNSSYQAGERAAMRGFSSSKDTAPHRMAATQDKTRLLNKTRGGFGATAGSVLGRTTSAPNLTGSHDISVPSPN
eukprot:Skav213534  [mRNA]  locus=scaffold1184:107662:114758:- [translate_table: standard]